MHPLAGPPRPAPGSAQEGERRRAPGPVPQQSRGEPNGPRPVSIRRKFRSPSSDFGERHRAVGEATARRAAGHRRTDRRAIDSGREPRLGRPQHRRLRPRRRAVRAGCCERRPHRELGEQEDRRQQEDEGSNRRHVLMVVDPSRPVIGLGATIEEGRTASYRTRVAARSPPERATEPFRDTLSRDRRRGYWWCSTCVQAPCLTAGRPPPE